MSEEFAVGNRVEYEDAYTGEIKYGLILICRVRTPLSERSQSRKPGRTRNDYRKLEWAVPLSAAMTVLRCVGCIKDR
jgi:hypothetical protein